MSHLIATFFYIGHLRPASGTWGSLAALPAAWAVYLYFGSWGVVAGVAVVFALGWWATIQDTKGSDDHDPSHIVIDEVAGQWIALLPVFFGADMMGVFALDLYPGWIAAFALFRLFDVWKPGPIGTADRRNDPLGVMLDDVIAGVFAAIGVIVLAAIGHLAFM